MKKILALLAIALPASVFAQGGMGSIGRGIGRMTHAGGDMTSAPSIVVPKLVNPVNLLVEHRQELFLTDTQFVRVIAIKRALDSTNAPSMRRVDSVERLFRRAPLFSEPSAARRDSLASARALVAETNAELRENISAAREKAYALLSSSQSQKAAELEDKAQKAIDEQEKRTESGGRRGGIGGARPPD